MPNPADPNQVAAVQRCTAVQFFSSVKSLLHLKLPAPVILMLIAELVEHGPNIVQKMVR